MRVGYATATATATAMEADPQQDQQQLVAADTELSAMVAAAAKKEEDTHDGKEKKIRKKDIEDTIMEVRTTHCIKFVTHLPIERIPITHQSQL